MPKSASKSVSRRVRRLETNSTITGNLLFQRRAPDEPRETNTEDSIFQGSPRKTPMRRREREAKHTDSIFSSANESIFADSPPQTVRTCRTRRPKATTTIFEDDEEEVRRPRSRHNQLNKEKLPPLRLQPTAPLLRRGRVTSHSRSPSRQGANESSVFDQSALTVASTDESQYQDKSTIAQSEGASSYRSGDESASNDASYSIFSTDGSSRSGNDSSLSLSSWDLSFGPKEMKQASASTINIQKPRGPSFVNRASSNTKTQPPKVSVPPSLGRLPEESPSVGDENSGAPEPEAQLPEDPSSTTSSGDSGSAGTEGLADQLSNLCLQLNDPVDKADKLPKQEDPATPPRTPTKAPRPTGLVSPSKKAAQIPKTPHRPSMDTFWSQEFVNEWNEKHSPQKAALAPPKPKSPVKSPQKDPAKKTFDSSKHDVAAKFVGELDSRITEGKIAELSESTGGVKLVWSKTLNTTAGRANWRRETIRTKNEDGAEVSVQYKHHASIELAEKVIDNEDRLLNVLAHEFCHLANFMVSGITKNPHGKEFKAWATKASRAFGDRGVVVTTKHTYEIDFKYIWECAECSAEYKRHSRSINPQKHRCGTCKGMLKQTKPTPRGSGKPSQYQTFVKEQMKIVKQENPGVPQKDIMKLIAAKWANRASAQEDASAIQDQIDEQLAAGLVDLTLGGSA